MSGQYHKRRSDILGRIGQAEGYSQCLVMDCTQTTMAKSGAGLNRNYCRRHVEHYRRHGSYSKPSYTAAEINPHRTSALAWLRLDAQLPEVREAVNRVRDQYWRGGRPEEAFRLAGKPPEERARVIWARLRVSEVDPLQPLAAWLAVLLCHTADSQPERKIEYRWVQAGKVLHRLSGGSHKRWERERSSGQVDVTELHKYPASRGRVLRHLGEQLAEAARPLEGHVESMRAAEPTSKSLRLPRGKKRTSR